MIYTSTDDGLILPVRWVYGRIQVSEDLLPDGSESREWRLDNEFGRESRHTPDRYQLEKMLHDERVREWNRRNIAALGRPAGEFRRANNCDGETCPLGQAREFYNRESGEMVCAGCWR